MVSLRLKHKSTSAHLSPVGLMLAASVDDEQVDKESAVL